LDRNLHFEITFNGFCCEARDSIRAFFFGKGPTKKAFPSGAHEGPGSSEE
jgi:hypothetical protein